MKVKFYIASALLASATAAMGQAVVPTFTEQKLPSGFSGQNVCGSIVYADVNNDGQMDMIVKSRDMANGWILSAVVVMNEGGVLSTVKQLSMETADVPYEVAINAFDYNNDGNIDYLVTGGYELLYKGNGDGTFSRVTDFNIEPTAALDEGERLYKLTAVADFDLDGYKDIIVRGTDGYPVLYINDGGEGTFTKVDRTGLGKLRSGAISVGDIDKDGYPDVILAGWSDDKGGSDFAIYMNNGDYTFTESKQSVFGIGSQKGEVMLADVNDDGYLDIFMSGETYSEPNWSKTTAILINDGKGTFSKLHMLLTQVDKSGMEWIDVNADGKMDLIFTGEGGTNETTLLLNEGSSAGMPKFTVKTGLLGKHRGGAVIAAYDYNADGCPDVALMGYNDNGGDKSFQIFNGGSNVKNTAPAAPSNLSMKSVEGKVTFTWDAATDAETSAEALRYNVYVEMADGSISTLVPADLATGALRLGDVNNAVMQCTYTLNVNGEDIKSWGVQTIDGGKCASKFAVYGSSGISSVTADGTALDVTCANGVVTVSADAAVTVTDLSGSTLMSANVKAGSALDANFPAGIYIVKAVTADGESVVKKFVVK